MYSKSVKSYVQQINEMHTMYKAKINIEAYIMHDKPANI